MKETLPPAARTEDGGGTAQRTLADQVYEALVNAIITGELAPGSKISEPELARRFGMSRGPLREAIRRLEARRLVTRTAHVGARVVKLDRDVLIEMFMVREALEGMAARLAAERMEDREIEELETLLDSHAEALRHGRIYYQREYDWDFHYRIVVGARSPMIEEVLCGDLYQLVKLYRYQHSSNPGRAERALTEHRRVVAALKDRDAELAELLMRRHISTARSVLQASLANRDAESHRTPLPDDTAGNETQGGNAP